MDNRITDLPKGTPLFLSPLDWDDCDTAIIVSTNKHIRNMIDRYDCYLSLPVGMIKMLTQE